MPLINFHSLPLTPEQARGARNYFGWTQSKAAEESALPINKIKRFEAGNYVPDLDFLNALRAFYEKSGFMFEDTPAPGANAKSTGQVFPGGVVGDTTDAPAETKHYRDRTGAAHVHHMRIALQDEGEMGRALDLIEDNEAKVTTLLHNPVKPGLFFGIAEETQAHHAEAVRLLAENGMLFARLFGRDIGGRPTADTLKSSKGNPATTRDLLHNLQADTHLVAAGDLDAKERRSTRKPANNISQALGLS
jgi:transcriptional regulator with XRE-family HTH domain